MKAFSFKFSFGSVRLWHWVSSAICLIGLILFAFTGITLNHAADIPVEPKTIRLEVIIPETVLQALNNAAEQQGEIPSEVVRYIRAETSLYIPKKIAEWSDEEVYLSLPRPGGDAWLTIDRETGDFYYESTGRGVISYLNDLHKGRHTGAAWSWFIDIFSVGCLIFALSGLLLLWRHAGARPSTWPMVVLGLMIPVLLLILFVH